MLAAIWKRLRNRLGVRPPPQPPPAPPPRTIGRVRHAPPLSVELAVDHALEQRLLAQTAAVWKRLGESDPHWSVLTWDRFRGQAFGELEEAEFYATGLGDYRAVEMAFWRAGLDLGEVRTVLELGCGAGRITEHFARAKSSVVAWDISEPHLALAAARMKRLGLSNVAFMRLGDVEDIRAGPKADLVFTVIVLQHNPPPVQAHLLSALLEAVKPGGFACFQIPTYIFGYGFDAATYRPQTETMEMHCLPMGEVLARLRRHGMDLLDVFQDDSSGSDDIVSHTFFATRRL